MGDRRYDEDGICIACWLQVGTTIPIIDRGVHERAHESWLDLPEEEKDRRIGRALFGGEPGDE